MGQVQHPLRFSFEFDPDNRRYWVTAAGWLDPTPKRLGGRWLRGYDFADPEAARSKASVLQGLYDANGR